MYFLKSNKKTSFTRAVTLTLLLIIISTSTAQAQTLKSEMDRLHKMHNVNFVYDSSIPTDKAYKGAPLNGKSLQNALATLFKDTGISYKVNGKYIILNQTNQSNQTNLTNQSNKANRHTRHTISGYVRSADGEALINATVYDLTTHQGTTTNAYGFYSLTLADGNHHLRFGYIGYDDNIKEVNLSANHTIVAMLEPSAQLSEVVVTDDLNSPLLSAQTGKRSLSAGDIKTEFSVFSSHDVVKTLQRISGVTSGVELASGLYVHGGDADENLFLIDGSPLYSVNHTLGLFSAFNVDVVKNVDFYKSGFPARYGGRLSSVVDVRTADGDMRAVHGSYRIGLLDGSFQIEGPIRLDKTSFNIGLRRSWIDLLTRPAFSIYNKHNAKDDDDINLNYFFHDFNAKVTNVFSERSRMSLSLYSGEDKLSTKDKYTDDYGSYVSTDITKEKYSWGNVNAALDWQNRLSPNLFANFTAFYTYNRSRITDSEDQKTIDESAPTELYNTLHTYHSTINDFGYRAVFDFRPSPHHHIRFGTDYTWHSFRPQSRRNEIYAQYDEKTDTTHLSGKNSHHANEWNVYAEDEVTVNDHWSLNAGVNASLFHIEGRDFTSADPRFAVKYQISPRLSLKASATVMSQYVHKISNSFLDLPTDYWVPTTARLRPMKSLQYAAGMYFQPNPRWLLSIEGYVKRTRHILQYASWTGLEPPAESWDKMVMDGRGRFYGLELDAAYKLRNLSLQGSYTLSWNKRKYDDFYPAWYYDKFDNRHKVNLSARWKLSPKVSMFAAWTLHSGNHTTVPTQYVLMPNVPDGKPLVDADEYYAHQTDGIRSSWMGYSRGSLYSFIYEKPNNLTLSTYHRIDIGFDFRHATRHGHEIVWNVSLYNAYCHLNSMYVDISFDNNGHMHIRNHAYFPILPSVSYTYKF